MKISINIHTPTGGESPVVQANSLNTGSIKTAAHAVFQQPSVEASSTLEGRIQALLKADDLSPDELKDEANACRAKVMALLDQVESVAFRSAFPVVIDLEGGDA